jgi:hypothetical protein
MGKITLSDVTSLVNENTFLSTTNANYATIETVSDTFLSRNGTAPNSMAADFDMNSFRILNCGDLDMNGNRIFGLDDAIDNNEAVPLSQVLSLIETATGSGSLIKDMVVLIPMDGLGSTITIGDKVDFNIPWNAVITGWTLLSKEVGSIVVDIYKDTYANYPPTGADTICGGNKPTLSSANKNTTTILTGWTTTVTAGDTFRINVDSCSGITRVSLILTYRKTT